MQVLGAPTSRVPGPWYSKWTSLVLDYHFLKGQRTVYVHALHRQYGPVVRIGPNEVDVTDLDAVRAIYGTKETFRKSDFYRRLVPGGQQSMFSTADVDFHRRHRRLLAGPMSETSLKSVTGQVDARVRLAVDKMGQEMKSRGAVDVSKFWLFMATDVIGELTFGESFRMLELGEASLHTRPGKNEYVGDLERVNRMSAIRVTFPSLVRFSRIVPLPVFKRAQETGQNFARYATESLIRHRKLVEADPDLVRQTLFTKLFKAEDDDTMPFDEVRDEARSYIIAGSDTTSNTLTYLTWSVCRNPRLRVALVDELQKLPADFTDAQLRHLGLLNHVIDETLRLYSAVPAALPRVVPPGGVELAGYRFDEGTVVCAQAYSMHRDHDIYPNPDAFVPSRWADPTKAMKEAYMPFGRGPRVCIGQHLAQIELRLATARFFLAFPNAQMSSLEAMSDLDMKPRMHFLLSPSGGRCLVEAR
ncbi:Cytochrome P450 [Ophiocordyceps sinensis CO18]|uniref:Cytochrome P450 n=1 Tax=Ophiocordyceps sinensis (strain Co18 / CGMCC 3.14243) TaxID=911162 RepID=T5AGD4_OPHSC|nr:Cytochrome P450 [Ophiocordyceps sinensis CO18]